MKTGWRILLSAVFSTAILSSLAVAEDITLNGYNASPMGVYDELTTSGDTMFVSDLVGTAGRLMIGTTSPMATTPPGALVILEGQVGNPHILSLYGRDPQKSVIAFESPTTVGYAEVGVIGTDKFGMRMQSTGFTTSLILDQQGRIGINTANPQGALHVYAPATSGGNKLIVFNVTDPTSCVDIGVPPFPATVAGTKLYVQGDVRITGTYYGTFNGVTADVAETFETLQSSNRPITPGDVVVIDPSADERVTVSSRPYDRYVAGVISTEPGLRLAAEDPGMPLALVGRVPTKVTTENGAIRRGDLLVTSSKPGFAMRADRVKLRQGMVIGKALGELPEGEGTILVLVSLQ